MWLTRKRLILGSGVGGTLAVGAVAAVLLLAPRPAPKATANAHHPGESDDEEFVAEEPLLVKTIRPRYDPSFTISDLELANVEAYYQADLRARVAGPVKFVQKDIGDPVARGTLLVEIAVPDLVQEVAQKEALVQQARAELAEAENDLKTAEA